jgi:hypothetical protein
MADFQFALVPASQSPVIVEMFRQTISISADDKPAARDLVSRAFPDGVDLIGEWFVEVGSLREVPK